MRGEITLNAYLPWQITQLLQGEMHVVCDSL